MLVTLQKRDTEKSHCLWTTISFKWETPATEYHIYSFTNSRVIFGPPVTTESRGRFESGFGYFEVFKKNWAPMPLAKVWAKPRRGQNPKWPPAAILDLQKKTAILRRFYSNNTIEVSFLTNSEVSNPFQGLFFQILAIFTLKSKMAAILPVIMC